MKAAAIPAAVRKVLAGQPVFDLHTHLYPPSFGTPVANATGPTDPWGMMLWGVDELVTYHYLVAELFRALPRGALAPEGFWKMGKIEQADLVWKTLFVDRTPVSEACRGVLTTLKELGLDPNERTLARYRKFFAAQDPGKHIGRVLKLAGITALTMTNDPFDDNERERWISGVARGDGVFRAVLRIDPLLLAGTRAAEKLVKWGYRINPGDEGETLREVRRFLGDWIDRIGAAYVAASLPPGFRYHVTDDDTEAWVGEDALREAVLPVCAERNIPFAMMIGVRRGVNPELKGAGDMGGRADVASVATLCREFPHNRFMVTMLSREDQHELAVAARKFPNLMVFGCWWFLNNPSLIEEITRMRMELLGTSFIPQHSDARVLEQVIYKWEHSREVLGKVMAEKYAGLVAAGRRVTIDDIRADAALLLKDNALGFLAG